MHLYVSSKYWDSYEKATGLVSNLLMKIYNDYKIFCLNNGK